ncbi:MAG: two-component system response regulator [Nitrospinae bacterium CG11_big_fil_rev_8_21_14_0_20_56_8]|nr:MAG: two-component system response regulator [Nitrospinae bacterium CG11_big_fil_rev_8_21_14_0_20_56_8]
MIDEEEILHSRLLIVDDEKANVLLLEEALKHKGYTSVRSTTDPLRACKIYVECRPDLVLLDLRMPRMDGFQVMAELRRIEKNSYVPILVLTAQTDYTSRMRALDAGAKDLLGKPFDLLEVFSRIRNILEVRLLHNQIQNQNRILETRVQERTRELEDTRYEVIHRLARAGEYRDNETGNHVVRMSRYSCLVAQAMGLDSNLSNLILHASPMHDIGKIGIPDGILLKNGKLSPKEWEIMKTHTTMGAEILDGSQNELMQMARRIALHHHEKWDGSGYPLGLKGDQIPLEARIVALCDVFDALTSQRPYKKSFPVDSSLLEIERLEGIHFDPRVVSVFKRVLHRILEIREEFASDAREEPFLQTLMQKMVSEI